MKPQYILKYFPWLIIAIILNNILRAWLPSSLAKMIEYGSDIVLAVCCVVYFYNNRLQLFRKYRIICLLYTLLLIYVVAALIKLQFVTSGMFPFFIMRMLTNFCCFGAIFIFMNERVVCKTMKLWWRFVPILFILSFWRLERSEYIQILAFIMFFIVFNRIFSIKKKFFIMAAFLFIVGWGVIQRIDYIIVVISILLFFMLRYSWMLSKKATQIFYHIQMWFPVVFLVLGLTGVFNILNFDSYVKEEYMSDTGERFNDDTRTFLYEEAIASAINHNYVLWGRTPGYGYDSFWVQNQLDYKLGETNAALNISGQLAQRVSEVFVVNMFTWCGLIGVLFFFVFYYKIGLGMLKQVENTYLRVCILYIGFFWIICFISHQFFVPSPDYILFYIILSLCLNPKLQKASDREASTYLRRLFK